jgi:hypothetical protein
MPPGTDSAQNKWIVALRVSSENRSKQTSRNNLNKKNHYAAAVSNPAGDGGGGGGGPWMSLSWQYCASSGRDLYDGPITRSGESYRVWCVSVIEEPHRAGLGPLELLSRKKRSFNTLSISSPLVVVNESQFPYVSGHKCGILCAIDQLTFMKNKTRNEWTWTWQSEPFATSYRLRGVSASAWFLKYDEQPLQNSFEIFTNIEHTSYLPIAKTWCSFLCRHVRKIAKSDR